MARKVTLVSGQWADLPLVKLAPLVKEFGYDGLELAAWGDHLDIEKAAASKSYCDDRRALLADNGLDLWAIQNHLSGQLVCDVIDERHYTSGRAERRQKTSPTLPEGAPIPDSQ